MKNFLRVGGVAVALAFANISAYAGAVNLTAVLHGGPQFTAAGGGFGANAVSPGVWAVHFNSEDFFAFCIEPTNPFNGASNNYTSAHLDVGDSVKRLYEGYYGTVIRSNLNNPAPKAKAFQLALWELIGDNGDLLTGDLRFNSLANGVVADANAMLATALGSGAIFNIYEYTALSSVGVGIDSQKLLTVSTAVPEPQTLALVLAGLGLMGLLARARHQQR